MTILDLDNVTLHFNGANAPALTGLSYQIQTGDFVILLGSNGSGKSSLLKLLYRQYQPNTGKIHFLKKPLEQHSVQAFSRHVAILTQDCSASLFTSLTLYENYLLVKKPKKCSLINHPFEKNFLTSYLLDFNPQLISKLNVPVKQLSGGEKQAFALALCLLVPPSLLLLDEHTSALDPKTSDHIMQLTQKMIAQHRITCLLTTHNLDIALQYGNRLLALRNGRIDKVVDQHAKINLSKEDLISGYY